MRIVQRLEIDGAASAVASARVRLELGAVGHGVFETQGDFRGSEGRPARFLLGRGGETLYPVLSGTVTEAHRLSSGGGSSGTSRQALGVTRLVVRDAGAALETPARLFLRHPTPRDVLDAITEACGVAFATPDGPLMTRRLPLFCEPGDCRAALAQLGTVWGMPDAVWAALPDGRVWWGPWGDSPWKALVVPIPDALIVERDPAARALLTQPMPAIRPGVTAAANGQAFLVWSVEHVGGEPNRQMRLTWRPLGDPDPFRALMIKAAPELGGRHVTRLGRVVAIADPTAEETLTNRNRPRYAVDVALLTPGGDVDAGYPLLEGLALPAQGGWFAFPEVGQRVRIGFDYGLPSFPYIAEVLSEGQPMPALRPGERVLPLADGAEIRGNARGDLTLQSNGTITLDGLRLEVTAEELAETLGRVTRQVAGDVAEELGGSLRQTLLGALIRKVAGDARLVTLGGEDRTIGGDKGELVGGNCELSVQQALTLTANLGAVLIESKTMGAEVKAALAVALTSLLGDVLVEAVTGKAKVKGALKAELEAAKVAAGNGAGVEVLAILYAMLTAAIAETHGTGVGPSTPPVNAADYTAQQTQLATIKG